MQMIRGDKLPYDLRNEVLRSYIYRWTKDNHQREIVYRSIEKPTIPLISDNEWLAKYSFYVTKQGKLSTKYKFAVPVYESD